MKSCICDMVILNIWLSYITLFVAIFSLVLGVVCIWASYRLRVERVYNIRISGVVLLLIGLYLLFLGSPQPAPGIPGG
jgi:threonine/homoserine/homoserine lactone efflux protein